MTANPDQSQARLRSPAPSEPFHVVLIDPEIPPNTGNIARLCAATGSTLHLVGTLGFRIDEHAVRRAGLDYWHLVKLHVHDELSQAEQLTMAATPHSKTWLFSGKSARSYLDVQFTAGDALVFGKESSGLSEGLLHERADRVLAIPTLGQVRSLNLANAVSIALYEALRQTGALSSAHLA